MSCYVMSTNDIRKIGYTLARCINFSVNSPTGTMATLATECSKIAAEFLDCYVNGRFSEERISAALYQLNAQAYNERYSVVPDPFDRPDPSRSYCLYAYPKWDAYEETPQPWHYALIALIDRWLCETAEGDTVKDSKRLAVQAFAQSLAMQIVQNSADYATSYRAM